LAWALPRTPLGEFTVLPRPSSWFKGAILLRGGEGRGGEGKETGREREGEGRGGEGDGRES